MKRLSGRAEPTASSHTKDHSSKKVGHDGAPAEAYDAESAATVAADGGFPPKRTERPATSPGMPSGSSPRSAPWRNAIGPFILPSTLLLIFTVHFMSGNVTSYDSRWSIHTAMSILKEGDTDLDEYRGAVIKEMDYSLEEVNGHTYSIFPIGVSLIAVPFVFLIDEGADALLKFDLDSYVAGTVPGGMEIFIGSVVVVMTSLVLYWIARLSLDQKYSLLLVLIFAFGTSAWSTASRGLWQHGPTMLMLSIALYLLLLARTRPHLAQFVSLPLAFAYVIRPTNSVSIALISLFVLIQYRQYFLQYIGWALTIAIPFFIFNLSVYDSILSPYYQVSPYYQTERISTDRLMEALAGNLISPSRGLFVFSPVLLFSILGVYLKIRNSTMLRLDWFVVAIMALAWVSISFFPSWWGGHSFGNRYLSDMTPFLVYFLIPVLVSISQFEIRAPSLDSLRKVGMVGVFGAAVVASVLIHYRGATDFDTLWWNVHPKDVEHNPGRIWSLDDVQFMRR